MTTAVSIATVLDRLVGKIRDSPLEALSPRIEMSFISAHLARYPRIDVLQKFIADVEKIKVSGGEPIVDRIAPGVTSIDTLRAPALAALPLIHSEAIRARDERRLMISSLTNTGGMRTLNAWMRLLAEDGLVSIMSWNGGPYAVLPTGSLDAFFGTNPLAYGIPCNPSPIVGDFATSEIAFMDLQGARRERRDLPLGAGIDSAGLPTVDPESVFVPPDSARLLPMGGGPKGSALMLLLEYLTGALTGGAMGRAASPEHIPHEFTGLLLAFPEGLFRESSAVRNEVSTMVDEIRKSRTIPGTTQVRIPGDQPDYRSSDQAVITLSDDTAAALGLSGNGG